MERVPVCRVERRRGIEGILQMPEAHKLLRIENRGEHGEFGVVEGYLGGIPYKELTPAEAPEVASKPKLSALRPRTGLFPALHTFAIKYAISMRVEWRRRNGVG